MSDLTVENSSQQRCWFSAHKQEAAAAIILAVALAALAVTIPLATRGICSPGVYVPIFIHAGILGTASLIALLCLCSKKSILEDSLETQTP